MTTPNRWAIRDAGIATFYSLATGKPVTTLRTLKTSGLETTGETVYSRGGRGNPKLLGFSSNREAKLTLQDAVFDNKALAMLTGNNLVEGASDVVFIDTLTVNANATALSKTPVGSLIGVYKLNADGTLGDEVKFAAGTVATGEYKISGKNLTFFSGDFADGQKIAAYYSVTTDATAKTLKVTSDAFGKTFKVVLDCVVRDEYTKEDYAAQITIPSAKFEDTFNLALAAEGDPAVLDMTMDVLKDPLSNDMWMMKIFDEDQIS
ncbi:hypothetical protein [Cohnella terricola]|uniref:Uncharacterized protein n=1 Tax=Cohnella terricola TaxID=1289167 RepID=A0A559JDL7_9BACL|nr:hypothetical protein [Cohnella terricola]TVX97965.1 hypothetical protein FPZ45_17115 [Cohnella terricola]